MDKFIEKYNLPRLNQDEIEKMNGPITRTRNEKGEQHHRNQRIIRDYYMQLYANKMENLEEKDKFLEKCNLPRLIQEEIEKVNGPITSTDFETVISKPPTNQSPGPDGFAGEFYPTFRDELAPLLLKLFQKVAEEGIPPN